MFEDKSIERFPEFMQCFSTALSGTDLTQAEAIDLERLLTTSPLDEVPRLKLIGYYFAQAPKTPEAEKRYEHLRWFVAHNPSHPILGLPFAMLSETENELQFERLKSDWESRLVNGPITVNLLLNAASFFSCSDVLFAEHCLFRAVELDPENADVMFALATHYAQLQNQGTALATEAFHTGLNLLKDERKRLLKFLQLPDFCLSLRQFEEAAEAAYIILESWDQYKSSLNVDPRPVAHSVLGRVALVEENVEKAKLHLDAMYVDVQESCSMRLDTRLASALLKIEVCKCVSDFLERAACIFGHASVDIVRLNSSLIEKEQGFVDPNVVEKLSLERQLLKVSEQIELLPLREKRLRAIDEMRRTKEIVMRWKAREDQSRLMNNESLVEETIARRIIFEEHLRRISSIIFGSG
jgi:tetratricopeptide (TPR) repeat protein